MVTFDHFAIEHPHGSSYRFSKLETLSNIEHPFPYRFFIMTE